MSVAGNNGARLTKPPPGFWRNVLLGDGCWEWMGNRHQDYGRFGRKGFAHRISYQAIVGPIPEGLELDHLCRNKGCINPSHLEAVTHRENILRGTSQQARNAVKTRCKRGHEFNSQNTYLYRGMRTCRSCQTLRGQARNLRRRAIATFAADGAGVIA